jgi:hypothetical protein
MTGSSLAVLEPVLLGLFAAIYVLVAWRLVRRFGRGWLPLAWIGAAALLSLLSVARMWARWPGMTEEGASPAVTVAG